VNDDTWGAEMKTFTIADIRSWKPCCDPSKHLPKGWSGTVLDILRHETIPPQDKLWVVCRENLIDAKTLRLFAVWCARKVQHLMPDQRSLDALDVAERYANGQATRDELAAAWAAARASAWDAAWVAAWAAARASAWDAAWASAWDAARGSARASAWDTARDAAWEKQIVKLIEMVEHQQDLTAAELQELAAKQPPPAEWYDDDKEVT